MPWSTLFNRRVVFDAIEMTDWRMYVETFPDGTPQLPAVHARTPRGPSAWTTTLQYVRASRGEFAYADHGTPWSVDHAEPRRHRRPAQLPSTAGRRDSPTAPSPSRTTSRCAPTCSTTFRIVGGKVVLDRIDLTTDGAESLLTGAGRSDAVAGAALSRALESQPAADARDLFRQRQVRAVGRERLQRHLPSVPRDGRTAARAPDAS